MTTKEFSDAFDTLLASYNHKAEFGDLSSYADVVLDEYEKSVFLTLALDNIVKRYFTRLTSPTGEGFDDSTRRQVDFSSLIKVASLSPVQKKTRTAVVKDSLATYGTFTITNKLDKDLRVIIAKGTSGTIIEGHTITWNTVPFNVQYFDSESLLIIVISDWTGISTIIPDINAGRPYSEATQVTIELEGFTSKPVNNGTYVDITLGATDYMTFDERGMLYIMPKTTDGRNSTEVLYILNEKLLCKANGITKDYIIVPINYREYDREMSKPYAQPLKKQAWRLFQNIVTGFDIYTELIPKEGTVDITDADALYIYKVRYVRRPQPIVLESLPNNLSIDGISEETPCELNPIIHIDILEEAIRLALNSKGIETRDQKAAREAQKK